MSLSRQSHSLVIVGHVGRDPEMRYTPDGKAVTNFSIAASSQFKKPDGTVVKHTVWFRVTAWEKQAEVVNQFVKKGAHLLVEGNLQPGPDGNPKTFQRQDGTTAASYEVRLEGFKFLGKKDDNNNNGGTPSAEGPVAAMPETGAPDDDAPF